MSEEFTVGDGEFRVKKTDLDDGIIVSGHGDNRGISIPELREMVRSDGPVEVR